MDQDRHRDVVGQVGDQSGRRRARDLLDPHRVAQHDLEGVDVVRGALGDRRRQPPRQQRVDLDGHHARCDLEQSQGERAESRADLDDHVVVADAGVADDAADGVGVDDEVLPALLGRAQVELGRQ